MIYYLGNNSPPCLRVMSYLRYDDSAGKYNIIWGNTITGKYMCHEIREGSVEGCWEADEGGSAVSRTG